MSRASTRHDVVVVGGGPAGATAAATAARAGLDVLLLEAGEHPRPHVGESLLPGIIPILQEIDALEAVERAGFGKKTGSTLWNWGRTPRWDLWFADSDAYDHAWLVDRSRFDAIVFEAAVRAGADARTRSTVREVVWEGDRVAGVRWHPRGESQLRRADARVVIDATGQSALIGRMLDLREPIEGLRHQAMWAHFEHADHLPPPRNEQALFVAQREQWWWAFPLGSGRTSVGVVQLDAAQRLGPPRPDFDAELVTCAELQQVLGPRARRVTPVRSERDWSYGMRCVAGPGWMSVGDAAGFIDPVLSTGVMLALHSGWHAGRTATSILSDRTDEPTALARFDAHHREMFGDLLRMVRFYYQQNLDRDDYFWESKRILVRHDNAIRPQKAFVVLTSGLVQNLALDEQQAIAHRRRTDRIESGQALAPADPDTLDFVCIHLRWRPHERPLAVDHDAPSGSSSSIYVVIEPADPVAPTLFATRNFHVNAIAPRHGNDPVSVPAFAPVLRALGRRIDALDTEPSEPLARFWRRVRSSIASHLETLPVDFELVRVFGE